MHNIAAECLLKPDILLNRTTWLSHNDGKQEDVKSPSTCAKVKRFTINMVLLFNKYKTN